MNLLLLKALAKPAAKTAPATKASQAARPADEKNLLADDLAELLDKHKKPAKKPTAKAEAGPAPGLGNPNFVALLALLKQHRAGGQFGPHNVSPGDEVAFSAGEFAGAGSVTATGEHGATVADKTSREHRVHWQEITGHKPAAKGRGKKGQADGV